MSSVSHPAIEVSNLSVVYGKGSHRAVAVDGLSFSVQEGETVGFIGANGAGKSSTIKTLMGFIFPESGDVRVLGEPAGTVESRRRIGYLPEVTLYYPFMKAREVLELYGGLHGVDRKTLKIRIPVMLEKVGLVGKGETLVKNFSKGMQQRIGIAQAIIAEPDLLIFDELSSGLDPVGRHDLRETLLELKASGKTIFFSSHELHEVEDLCDRVIMIRSGEIVADATPFELVTRAAGTSTIWIAVEGEFDPALLLQTGAIALGKEGEYVRFSTTDPTAAILALGEILKAQQVTLTDLRMKRPSLEDVYLELMGAIVQENLPSWGVGTSASLYI